MNVKHQLLLPQDVKIGIGLIRKRLPNTLSDKIALSMSRINSQTAILKWKGLIIGVAVFIVHQSQKFIELSYVASDETRQGVRQTETEIRAQARTGTY